MWIRNLVKELIAKHGTNNPYEIAQAKNIYVFEHDMHEEIFGFYKYIRRNKFIYINSILEEQDKLFTCCHELAHSEMHSRIDTPFLKRKTLFSVDKLENEANRFAIELLIPDENLQEYLNQQMTMQDIALLHNVPLELVELKCKKLFL
ncbi:ImmA/IrrE family metallo-endopeptidase [Solibacillus sp. FSL R7-0668]|uniref:ImmA/IrrE family metallo-endopeptidase n=1 Tax=Solibacillus sp. FSL R7-0668 TaxID=2921688 RepID=UPI0030F8B174